MGLFGKGVGRICAVVAARGAVEMSRQIRAALRLTPTLELRLDWLESDAERGKILHWVRRNKPHRAVFLATCRRKAGGGLFRGDVDAELRWLRDARLAGCAWCDIEIETMRRLRGKSLQQYALPRVMLSLHDFRGTPRSETASAGCERSEIEAFKIAAHSKTISDSVRLLSLGKASRNLVMVPMGPVGLPARILALQKDSALAYAPVSTATAPGQVSLRDLKELYRAHKLSRKTKVFGVIGSPIEHSFSPLLHNTGFRSRAIDAVYLPFLVKDLRDFLSAAPEFGLRGFSVTLPHKQSILKHLRECDALAAKIGAVNTVVVRKDGSLYGCNTDYVGVLRALERRLSLSASRVLIFGAGGSARAAAFALARAGAHIFICARRQAAAHELARAAGGEAIPRRALPGKSFDAIINATPIGMYPHDRISPLAANELNCRIVMDLIYRPERTELLRIAARKGISTVSGLEMFLSQGFAQWELWLNRPAPEQAMRKAVLAGLRAQVPSALSAKPARRTR